MERRFARLSWAALIYVLGVIVWGAYVRATGSGAGCGSHWPLCNGEVMPTAPSLTTLIELSHRITSGLAGLFTVAQVVLAFRIYPRRHRVRAAVAWSALFMLLEALIGALLVRLELVADNATIGRAMVMSLHLVNTFLLVGAMTLTAHFASGGRGFSLRAHRTYALFAVVAVGAIFLTGVSGAVAALGDTLFPADDLGTALAHHLSPTGHILVRLRIAHPFFAVGGAFAILAMRHVMQSRRDHLPGVVRFGGLLRLAILVQMVAGLVNVMLLAPVWLQLVHLLLADLVFIALVLFLASALVEAPEPTAEALEVEPRPA